MEEGESIEMTACWLYLNPNSFFLLSFSSSLFSPSELPSSADACHASDLPCHVCPSQNAQCADHDGRKREKKKRSDSQCRRFGIAVSRPAVFLHTSPRLSLAQYSSTGRASLS